MPPAGGAGASVQGAVGWINRAAWSRWVQGQTTSFPTLMSVQSGNVLALGVGDSWAAPNSCLPARQHGDTLHKPEAMLVYLPLSHSRVPQFTLHYSAAVAAAASCGCGGAGHQCQPPPSAACNMHARQAPHVQLDWVWHQGNVGVWLWGMRSGSKCRA